MGHPSGNSQLHVKMTAKRREKIKAVAATLPPTEVHGDAEGEVLLVGWGSTWGSIREALNRLRSGGLKAGQVHLRSIHPLPSDLGPIFQRYRKVLVVEMNDEGLYGYGQLATLLRAALALPSITSITKTDGLNFKVAEVVDRVNRALGVASP
jgi:2-oxoglutarate ferredoxin oxidoreductase subunit alpha